MWRVRKNQYEGLLIVASGAASCGESAAGSPNGECYFQLANVH
jgi:hypothetical protein